MERGIQGTNIYVYEEIMAENISNQINLQMQTQQTQSRINTM